MNVNNGFFDVQRFFFVCRHCFSDAMRGRNRDSFRFLKKLHVARFSRARAIRAVLLHSKHCCAMAWGQRTSWPCTRSPTDDTLTYVISSPECLRWSVSSRPAHLSCLVLSCCRRLPLAMGADTKLPPTNIATYQFPPPPLRRFPLYSR